ncbi:MAG: hydrogenase maturation nickel metallochaperone HypA [Candidatus Eisenbacteria bacterium]|nr:hydrogenase maturation nickel metallochaperone HypA [Candidatus Eisenbacteria bacterium]
MHEMSIALNIINIAGREAQEHGAAEIRSINIEIGALAGVEISALEFCYRVARKGTAADRAELVIDEIQALGFCRHCEKEFPIDFFVSICPDCGEAVNEIRKGRELRVRSIQIV